MKIETITGGSIDNISVFPWAREPTKTEIVKISEKNIRENRILCIEAVNAALGRLPPGFYTLVCDECGYARDFRLGVRHGVRFRPHDGTSINTTHQRPCLRVIVST